MRVENMDLHNIDMLSLKTYWYALPMAYKYEGFNKLLSFNTKIALVPVYNDWSLKRKQLCYVLYYSTGKLQIVVA